MRKIIGFFMNNPVCNFLISLLTYIFYGLVIGISAFPSIFLIYTYLKNIKLDTMLNIVGLALTVGVAVYLFFIVALIVFGVIERLLVTGFKKGRYPITSGVFARWLVYSGLHIILLNMVLPYVSGTVFAKMFYKILGCKIGKNVFINTRGLHDAYLLEIGDNVVIGGDANITCHIFEGNTLILDNIKIGDNTLIGAETYIMPGVEIGDHCSIGVKSYIRKKKKIPPKTILMSVPAVPARQLANIIKEEKEEVKI